MGQDRNPLQTRACGRWLPAVVEECRLYVWWTGRFPTLRLPLPQHTHDPCKQAEPERTTGGCALARLKWVALATRPATSASTLRAILVLRVSPHPHTMAHRIAGGGPWCSGAWCGSPLSGTSLDRHFGDGGDLQQREPLILRACGVARCSPSASTWKSPPLLTGCVPTKAPGPATAMRVSTAAVLTVTSQVAVPKSDHEGVS